MTHPLRSLTASLEGCPSYNFVPMWTIAANKEYGTQTSRYFAYAAVIVRVEDEPELNRQLAAMKQRYFGTEAVELKSNWIRQEREPKRRYLDAFGIGAEALDSCVEEVYGWAEQESITFAAAVVDKLQMKERYGDNAWHPSATAYQFSDSMLFVSIIESELADSSEIMWLTQPAPRAEGPPEVI